MDPLKGFKVGNNTMVPRVGVTTSSASSVQLSPGVEYSFGQMSSLTITLAAPDAGIRNEYFFEFDSGSTATNLSVPATVVWKSTVSIAANAHYEVSIKYDANTQTYYGIIAEWK